MVAFLVALIILYPPVESPDMECAETVQRIVQHEVGNMDEEAWQFLTDQVIYDTRRMSCESLIQWRWKIGKSIVKVRPEIKRLVKRAMMSFREFGQCQFVGSLGDIAVWRSYGYPVSVDYRHSIGNLTVIGVNCQRRINEPS